MWHGLLAAALVVHNIEEAALIGALAAERRFGDVVVPSQVTVGWWYGTPRYKPFFEATILSAEPLP